LGIVPYTTTRNPRYQRTLARMASSESKVVGAKLTIALPTDEKRNLSLPTQSPSVSSPVPTTHSLQEDQARDFDPSIGAKPCSPFYCHPTTTASREQLRCDAQLPGRGYCSQDLESGMRTPAKRSMDISKPQCSKLWQQEAADGSEDLHRRPHRRNHGRDRSGYHRSSRRGSLESEQPPNVNWVIRRSW